MWYQLKIESCPENEAEQVSTELEDLGALSIMLTDKNDNPVLEPAPGTTPLWPEVNMQALFAQAEEAQLGRESMNKTRPHLKCSIEVLEDKNWERAWMDDFKPRRFGKRLWICPTWSTPPESDAVNLILDPGLAFGTGTHPTTSLCLTWLDQAELVHKSVIDYGCGSGILSLAAIMLGANHVYAVDIDEQALLATQNNASSNSIDERSLSISSPESLQVKADLIIANILLTPLLELQNKFHQLLNPQGTLVVSGILSEQGQQLMKAYAPQFTLVNEEYLEEWALLVFRAE